MKTAKSTLLLFLFFVALGQTNAQKPIILNPTDASFVREQSLLDYKSISTWFQNNGTFNQDIRTNNTPGFMWQKGTNRFAIFTTGLTIGAYVNSQLRLAAASYTGEYQPGIVKMINGVPTPFTDNTFRIYKVTEGDNCSNNPDWANWGLMVPYGAPYEDINSNGLYDPCVDIAGVIGAGQTIFICMTDAFQESHNSGEGFGGGTLPLFAELRLTAWSYGNTVTSTQDAQFVKFQIINKNTTPWDSSRFSIVCDPDLGFASDDMVGCDINRNIGYCYNATNIDGTGAPPSYGQNPPAVGIRFLRSIKNKWSPDSENFSMNGFCYFRGASAPGPICERDPSNSNEAYNLMGSIKIDGTPWVNPITWNQTKYTFPGNPEAGSGWTELYGLVNNCGGADTGNLVTSLGGDKRFVMSTGRDDLTFQPLDTQEIIMTQLIARGSNNLNSVTKLLAYSDAIAEKFGTIYIDPVSVKQIGSEIPSQYYLSNNYPNPFNPVTKIDYSIPKDFEVDIIVYDMLGNEVAVIYKGIQKAGNYSIHFDGSKLSSGIYFLNMKSGAFIQTRKMILLK